MVGVEGFEPPTLCTQNRCASQAALYSEEIKIMESNYIVKLYYSDLMPLPKKFKTNEFYSFVLNFFSYDL